MSSPRFRKGQPFLYVLLATVLIVTFSLAFDAWAAPANSPLRQSVPTKTPLPGDEALAGQESAPARPSPNPIPTLTPEPTVIPESGGGSVFVTVGIGLIVVVVVAAVALFLIRPHGNQAE